MSCDNAQNNCGDCSLAKICVLPREELEKRRSQAAGNYNIPLAKNYKSVILGSQTVITRHCTRPRIRIAFSGSLCSSPNEFKAKVPPT